jgi:multiple sugar transport system substrate-binding protein
MAANGALPAVRTDKVMELYMNQKGFPQGCESAFEVKQLSFEVPVHEKSGTIGTILNEENSLIMTGSLSLDDGLKELTDRVNEALNED